MANNRQYRRKMHSKIDSIDSSFSSEMFKVVKVLIAVLVFLAVFYFLTVYLLERDDTSSSTIDTTPAEADIQYQEILAGNSFSMNDDHYFVLYYDMSSDELKSAYTNMVSTYEDKDEHFPIYTVDMSSTFNKQFVSDTSNPSVQSIDNLKISGPTLIEINQGRVSNYVEGIDTISDALE